MVSCSWAFSLGLLCVHMLCVPAHPLRRVDTMQKQRELMQEELKRSTEKTLSAEERAQQMDQMLLDEEARVAQLEKEMAAYREKQVRMILSMHPRNL